MRRIVIALAAAALSCSLSACNDGQVEPSGSATPEAEASSPVADEAAACSGTFMWHKGSVPPPFSYNWTLTLHGDNTADFIAEVSHVEEPPLVEEKGFDVDPADAQALCASIAEIPEDTDPLAGGSYIVFDMAGRKGGSTQPDDFTEPTLLAVDVVGEDRIKAAVDAHEKYQAENQ